MLRLCPVSNPVCNFKGFLPHFHDLATEPSVKKSETKLKMENAKAPNTYDGNIGIYYNFNTPFFNGFNLF